LLQVKILLHGVIAMRNVFREVTGLDIVHFKTIASACMAHFRCSHLNSDEELALITEQGYGLDKEFKQSTLARKYLKFFAHQREEPIQDTDTRDPVNKRHIGEFKIGNYRVDGFIKREDRKDGINDCDLIVEVHG